MKLSEKMPILNYVAKILDETDKKLENNTKQKQAELEQENNEYKKYLRNIEHSNSALQIALDIERYRKNSDLTDIIRQLNIAIESINDWHWQINKEKYFRHSAEKIQDEITETNYERQRAELNAILDKVFYKVSSLAINSSYENVAKAVSNIISPLRAKKYREISDLREEILHYIEHIIESDDSEARLNQEKHRVAQDKNRKTTELETKIAEIEQNYLDEEVKIIMTCLEIIDTLPETIYNEPEEIDRNLLIISEQNVSDYNISLMLDIMKSEPKSDIYVVDISGLGSNYKKLSELLPYANIKVISDEKSLIKLLDEISNHISKSYKTGNITARKKYIFIENMNENIGDRHLENFCRILENSEDAAVFLLMSLKQSLELGKKLSERLGQISKNTEILYLDDNMRFLNFCNFDGNISEKIESTLEFLIGTSSLRAVIPLGDTLPDEDTWQKKKSDKDLEFYIGEDENSSPVKFILNEEKPYAMIVGDVDVGKSSLLHTILLSGMANYSHEELRFAIADFKNGAEFNIYAASNQKSVDAVINDQDIDAMVSFLQYYVRQISLRQKEFDKLASEQGLIIRKFETYRKYKKMPRIVLIIDEFQSMFENGTQTARLLSKLVRDGRTYGIHIVMASQRARFDSPQNGFSDELKNFFTSRFAFRSPQSVARVVFSDRCADTSCENSGISKASLLNKGQAIFNCYQGQTERDNKFVHCYYAADDLIQTVCKILNIIQGEAPSILLRKNANSIENNKISKDKLALGMSVSLHKDDSNTDILVDDTEVYIKPNLAKNIIVSGKDKRVLLSTVNSALKMMDKNEKPYDVHIYGKANNELKTFMSKYKNISYHNTNEAEQEAMKTELNSKGKNILNIFIEPNENPIYAQSMSTFRPNAEAEIFKQVLKDENNYVINIIYANAYKNLRSNLAYAVSMSSIKLMSVGDTENLSSLMPNNRQLGNSDFDVLADESIKAYYLNSENEKTGKIIMYKF